MRFYVNNGLLRYDETREEKDVVIADETLPQLYLLKENADGDIEYTETDLPDYNPVLIDEADATTAYEIIIDNGILFLDKMVPEGYGQGSGCKCDVIQDMLDDHRSKCVVQVAAIVEDSEKDVIEHTGENGKTMVIVP